MMLRILPLQVLLLPPDADDGSNGTAIALPLRP